MKIQHDKNKFTKELIAWYDENARILPWREDVTPYRVWVSEIMLQQTRVEAVKPYFERFLKQLPTISDLAKASEDDLHKLWEGLGYYRRVINMKKAAQLCVDNYDKELPSTYEELLKLPGIGSYTAGAIASIAFQEAVPAVDGNVLRVFSRVLVSEDDILKESTKKKFQAIIQEYIPKERCSDFNQALMEIGALVCVPNAAPRCNICPLASQCIGYQSGQAHRLPNKLAKKKRRIEKKTVLLITYKNKVLLKQRPQNGLLSGLYEFDMHDEHVKRKDVPNVLANMDIKKIVNLHKSKHIFSHIEWHMSGYLIELNSPIQGLWCTSSEMNEQYAIPTALKHYKEALYTWWEEHTYE